MGTRMSIWPEGHPELEVGNDHKLYCYASFEDIEKSFSYLFSKALAKSDDYSIYLEFENPVKEAYDTFCCCAGCPDVDGVILSEDEFREFSRLYLNDFMKHYPDSWEDYERVFWYMQKMCDIPGNKVLEWG